MVAASRLAKPSIALSSARQVKRPASGGPRKIAPNNQKSLFGAIFLCKGLCISKKSSTFAPKL